MFPFYNEQIHLDTYKFSHSSINNVLYYGKYTYIPPLRHLLTAILICTLFSSLFFSYLPYVLFELIKIARKHMQDTLMEHSVTENHVAHGDQKPLNSRKAV